MKETQRGDYWLKVERLRRTLDKKYSSLFYDALRKEMTEFARIVKRDGPNAALSQLGVVAWTDGLITVLNKMYREVAVTFGNATFRAVSVDAKKAANPFGLNEDFINELVSFLINYGFVLASLMTQTTKKRVSYLLVMWMEEGKSKEEMAELLLSDKELSYLRMRANRISRTEVARASNYAALEGAAKLPYLVDKIWIATRDARTRRIPRDYYDHWEMDGVIVPYNEPFVTRDKVGRPIVVDAPGDPTAPKGFTINCRCAVGFIPRRDSNGNLIMK